MTPRDALWDRQQRGGDSTTVAPGLADPRPAPIDGVGALTRRQRMGVLGICSMSLLIVGLDATIVNVVLPSIGRQYHSTVSGLQWIVDAYALVVASLLMLSGSMADRLGRRRIFVTGLSVFSAGSLLCGLAPSLSLLIAFRIVQAVGGSMLNPVSMSIVSTTFTDPKERAQAVGWWTAMFGVSMALGPVVGGLLVGSAGWRSAFWINLPVGLVAMVLTLRFIPESRAPNPRRVDWGGQALIIVFLASLTYGIIEASDRGWTSPVILVAFALAVVAMVLLISWEARCEEPLIDLRFFRSIPFSGASMIAVTAFATLGGFLFLNTLYLQNVRGLSALQAGLCTLPLAAMIMLLPPVSGRLAGARGDRLPLLIAGTGITAGCVMLSQIGRTTSFGWLFAAYIVFGTGFGFINAPITNTAVSGMPRSQAGLASGIIATSRQVGYNLGVAVVGVLLATSLGDPHSLDALSGTRAGWWVLAGCGAAVLFLGRGVTTTSAQRTAERTARYLDPEFMGEQGALMRPSTGWPSAHS